MALMAVDYSPELSPLASPPSCLRHSSIMSRLRLTAPSAVHLALPRGVSARTTLFRVVKDHAQRVAGTGGEAADAVAHGDAVPAALARSEERRGGEGGGVRGV